MQTECLGLGEIYSPPPAWFPSHPHPVDATDTAPVLLGGMGTWAASGISRDSPGSYSHDQDVPDILPSHGEELFVCECLPGGPHNKPFLASRIFFPLHWAALLHSALRNQKDI